MANERESDKSLRHNPREVVLMLNDSDSVGRALPLCVAAECIEQLQEALRVALGESSSMTMPEVRALAAPSHVAPLHPGSVLTAIGAVREGDTPRVDALLNRGAEYPFNELVALAHQLERELAEATAGKVSLTNMLAEEMAAGVARSSIVPNTAWQPINTAPNADDLIWLMRGDSIDGPRPLDPYDFDRYEFWAPCEAPPVSVRSATLPRNMALVCATCRFPVPEKGERFCDAGDACPHRAATDGGGAHG